MTTLRTSTSKPTCLLSRQTFQCFRSCCGKPMILAVPLSTKIIYWQSLDKTTLSSDLAQGHTITGHEQMGLKLGSREFGSWDSCVQHMDALSHWKCDTCGKLFGSEHTVEEHERTLNHRNPKRYVEKPSSEMNGSEYKCDRCKKPCPCMGLLQVT